MPNSFFVILDEDAIWDKPAGKVAYWGKRDVPKEALSIPELTEKYAKELRSDYLAWIHDIGESLIGGKSLRSRLAVDKNISFWWQTILAQKSPFVGSSIKNVFKLRIMEKLYLESKCHGIILCSSDQKIHLILSAWCAKMGHPYKRIRIKGSYRRTRVNEYYGLKYIFSISKAFYYFVWWLWSHRSCFSLKRQTLLSKNKQGTIITYFPNIDYDLAKKGIFRSRYFEGLHKVINESPFNINWVFIYSEGQGITYKEALSIRDKIQGNVHEQKSSYFFLEEFINLKAVFCCLRVYTLLLLSAFWIYFIKKKFCFNNSLLNLWPLFEVEWRDSISGHHAMSICIMHAAFQSFLSILQKQDWCIYLWENQPWEHSLIWAWEEKKQGNLIGYQHSTLRYLNMETFEDKRTYKLTDYRLPLPDVLAINGSDSRKLLEDVGFPRDKLFVVEALRYMYLNEVSQTGGKAKDEKDSVRRMLVLTSFKQSETDAQLSLLSKAVSMDALKQYTDIIIKSHPFCPVSAELTEKIYGLRATIIDEPLWNLWNEATVVYSANSTTASLETLWVGLPVIIYADYDDFNLSPLYGFPGVKFVSTVDEFVRSLDDLPDPSVPKDYFCLDPQLGRWRSLLGLPSSL